MKHLVFVAYSS